jgi:hypothetical protein
MSADGFHLEYQGLVSTTVRTLKLVSISTAILSLIGGPVYLYATLGSGGYAVVKVASATGFTCFGLFTTGVHDQKRACSCGACAT